MCKLVSVVSNLNFHPGSVARITCEAVDEYGFETAPITILSDASDAKGYFFATISPFDIENKKKKLTQCKAFLELSTRLLQRSHRRKQRNQWRSTHFISPPP